MARNFTTGNTRLRTTTASVPLSGGFTIAVVLCPTNLLDNVYPLSAGFGDASIRIQGAVTLTARINGSTYNPAVNMPVPVGAWSLLAVTKASGSAAPRMHIYTYSDDAWVRSTSASTVSITSTQTDISMGYQSDFFTQFQGDIAAGAYFPFAMTDDQLTSMPYSLSTWHAMGPSFMWVLDQESTSQQVADLAGRGGNQTTINGTSVSTNNVPILGYGHPVLLATHAPVGGGPVTHDADASLAVTATIAAASTVTRNASASLTATATIATAATGARPAGASLAVTAALAGAATADRPTAATLASTAAITAAAASAKPASSTLAAVANISATATLSTSTTASVAATATISTAASRVAQAAATLPVSATISAAGSVSGAGANADLAVTATIGATASRVAAAQATLSATASISAASAGDRPAQSTLAAVAAITVTASRAANIAAALPVTATITTAGAIAGAGANADLAVVATIGAAGSRTVLTTTTLTVVTTISAQASTDGGAGLTVTATVGAAATRVAVATGGLTVVVNIATSGARLTSTAATLAVFTALLASMTVTGPVISYKPGILTAGTRRSGLTAGTLRGPTYLSGG